MSIIQEQSAISSSQSAQFFPKEKFSIPKATVQKVKTTITSLNSGIVTKSFGQTTSAPFSWLVNANNMSVFDLSQFYFNIVGTLKLKKSAGLRGKDLIFGNLFVGSLFQNASLEMGGAVIALNNNPGIDGNIQAMLKFDYNDLKNYGMSDREFMINKTDFDVDKSVENLLFSPGDFVISKKIDNSVTGTFKTATDKKLNDYKNTTIYWMNTTPVTFCSVSGTDYQIVGLKCDVDEDGKVKEGYLYFSNPVTIDANVPSSVEDGLKNAYVQRLDDSINNIDMNSVVPNNSKVGDDSEQGYYLLPFRCKLYLSDLFNYTVDSLDYIFNREIKITLTRSATSFLICNPQSLDTQANVRAEVAEISKFDLIAFSYLLTDTARNQLIKFYNRPVETLFGVQTINLAPLVQYGSNVEQTITLPLTVNYDTKAIILAFPKCSNPLVPLKTRLGDIIKGQITDADKTAAAKTKCQASWIYSNSNSLNYAGLRYIRIANTNNSSIYTYDFQGTAEEYQYPSEFLKSFDYSNANDDGKVNILDYREAYEQYKNLRLLFGKAPDNGLDYYTYLKDYCIIPIDLTGTNIPPNTRILVTLQFANWGGNYNPLCYGNVNKENNTNLLTTNLMAVFLGSDVLTYNPDGSCVVKHVLSANPNEKNVNLI
jgi:hypothetical protein